MTRFAQRVIPAIALCAALAATGCSKSVEAPELQPTVAPPAIHKPGEMSVGVDLDTPPFAGKKSGREAGLDIDVAAALAEKLGLTVRFVDVKPSDAATALAEGTVDVVFSVPLSDTSLSAVSLAGTYASTGPALFVLTGSTASVEPSLTLASLVAPKVGAQKGSAAFWELKANWDAGAVKEYETLRAALEALQSQEIPVVAGDAFVGAYLARDLPGVQFAGQVGPAWPLSVAVAAENSGLGEAVREALDGLAADGVLDTLRRKWVGELPELESMASTDATDTP